MPRLINTRTRVVVNVSDDTAARLGDEWTPADQPKPAKRSSKRKPAPKADDKPADSDD